MAIEVSVVPLLSTSSSGCKQVFGLLQSTHCELEQVDVLRMAAPELPLVCIDISTTHTGVPHLLGDSSHAPTMKIYWILGSPICSDMVIQSEK